MIVKELTVRRASAKSVLAIVNNIVGYTVKEILIGMCVIAVLTLLTFIYAKIEETIGVIWIYIAAFLIFASYIIGKTVIILFGL